jgi:hypothetical protein
MRFISPQVESDGTAEQPMQFGVDEARLRQQPLRRGFVVRLRGRREVRIDLDAPAIAVAAARMDRQAFEVQEDLDVVLGELDAQLLVPMDVRSAVEHGLHEHIAVGMERCGEPLAAVDVVDGQRLECRAFQRFEALAARDAEARVASCADALDALAECLVDLMERGELRATIAEAHIAHQDLDQAFDDRLITSHQLHLVPTPKRSSSSSLTPFVPSAALAGCCARGR